MIVSFKIFESSVMATMGKSFDFDSDVKLPDSFYISSLDKRIKVSWNDRPKTIDDEGHDFVGRLKRYKIADNVSDYLKLFQKSFSDILPIEVDEKIEETDKCCIHLIDRDVYILFNIKGSKWYPKIFIRTILPNEPKDYDEYWVFEVDDSFYLV